MSTKYTWTTPDGLTRYGGPRAPEGDNSTAEKAIDKEFSDSSLPYNKGLPPADYRTKVEEALAKAFRIRGQKTASAAPLSSPTVSTVTSGIYIDGVDGNNSNAGTAAAPYRDIWKIGGNRPAGQTYYIACDGVYEYVQTLAAYIATPVFSGNNFRSSLATSAAPVTVTTYNPRKVANPTRPVIKWYALTTTADWTQETGIQGGKVWSIAWADATSYRWRYMNLLLGSSDTVAVAPFHDSSTPSTLYAAGQFTADANKVYIYVPDGRNPVAYYGSVKVCGGKTVSNSSMSIFSTTLDSAHLKIKNLAFYGCRVWDIQNYGSAGLAWPGLEISKCTFTKCPAAVTVRNSASTIAADMGFNAHHNDVYDSPMAAFTLITTSVGTVSGATYANYLDGACLSNDAQGGLVSLQAVGNPAYYVWGNYGKNVINGVGSGEIDGSLIYPDIGSANIVVYGNIAESCGMAFQANMCKGYYAISNLAIDCASMFNVTHAAMTSNDSSYTSVIAHNTYLWTGRISDMNSLPKGINIGGNGNADWKRQGAFNFQSAGGYIVGPISFVNNAIINAGAEDYPNKFGIATRPSLSSTHLLAGNAIAGMSKTAAIAEAGSNGVFVSDLSSSLNACAFIGARSDATTWVAGASTGVARPSSNSPLHSGGSTVSLQYKDIEGKDFATIPTIGCYEVNA